MEDSAKEKKLKKDVIKIYEELAKKRGAKDGRVSIGELGGKMGKERVKTIKKATGCSSFPQAFAKKFGGTIQNNNWWIPTNQEIKGLKKTVENKVSWKKIDDIISNTAISNNIVSTNSTSKKEKVEKISPVIKAVNNVVTERTETSSVVTVDSAAKRVEQARYRVTSNLTERLIILDRVTITQLASINTYTTTACSLFALKEYDWNSYFKSPSELSSLYFNPLPPFSMVCVGVQGSGKSYTTNIVIESCMKLKPKPTVLALHYDRADETAFCEMLSLTSWAKPVVDDIVVFTSAWNFTSRSKLLAGLPHCTVKPLLFEFSSLSAKHLMSMMCFDGSNSMPLYASIVLDILRQFQRSGKQASLREFQQALDNIELNPTQKLHLEQRMSLLKSVLLDSSENAELCAKYKGQNFEGMFHDDLKKPGRLVIVDMTNPLLTPEDANSIFSICTDIFIGKQCPGGKLLVLDEAHKYISSKLGDLGNILLEIVRQMRHYDIRICLSTQSPETISHEFFELSSIVIMHHFFSPTWFNILSARIPIDRNIFTSLCDFGNTPGKCILYSSRAGMNGKKGQITAQIQILKRKGAVDLGMNRRTTIS